MAFELLTYPVEIISGEVRNVLPGFEPVEVSFSNSGEPTIKSVEVSLVDPVTLVDVLGFNLYSDFFNNEAFVDVSIIVGKTSQAPTFISDEIVESRIKFFVKYRAVYDDNTTGDWVTLDTLPPLIVVHGVKAAPLDEILNPAELPRIYDGYPNLFGFMTSDSNNQGDTLGITYDLIAIDGTVVSGENELVFYATGYGVMNANYIHTYEASDPAYIDFEVNANSPNYPADTYGFPNAGGVGATDWINATNGIAEYWTTPTPLIAGAIVSDFPYDGNAQRVTQTVPFLQAQIYLNREVPVQQVPMQIQVTLHLTTGIVRVYPDRDDLNVYFEAPISGETLVFTTPSFTPENPKLQPLFVLQDDNAGSARMTIDKVNFIIL